MNIPTHTLLKRNQLIKLLTALLLLLQIPLWLGSGSIFSLLYTYYSQYQVIEDNERLTLANHQLIDKIASLQNGTDEIQARARLELGLVGQNEVYYQVIKQ